MENENKPEVAIFDEAYADYERWLEVFRTSHQQLNEVYRKVASEVKHFYRLYPRYLQTVSEQFDLPGSFVYCSMIEIQQACATTTEKNLRIYTWMQMKRGALKKRKRRDGRTQSLAQCFVEEFFEVFGHQWRQDDPVVMSAVKKMFVATLANHVNCAVWERRIYRQLHKAFGDKVRWADRADEARDVQIRLFDLPVSVKAGTEMAEAVYDRYRSVPAFREPMFYLGLRFDREEFKGVLTVARRASGEWKHGELPDLRHWVDTELFNRLI